MPRMIKKGSVNVTDYIYIGDSAAFTPETGITIADLDLQYVRNGAAPSAKVDATALAATDTAHTDNYMIEIDATDQPGLYRVDWPDAAFATGVDTVICTVKGTGFQPAHKEYQLVAFDPQDTVRLGLTALPNAAADAAGGVTISDAGGLDLDTKLANTNEITAARMGALTDWINGGRLDLLLDAIPTTAMRGTDNAALASVCTEARLTALTDWLNGGRLDLILDIIAADTTTDIPVLIAALNDISAADIWTAASARVDDYGTLLEKLADFWFNEKTVTDSTGAVVLRNEGDSADLADWGITDNATLTVSTEVVWV